MSMREQANTVRAGVFVVASIALAVGIIIALTGVLERLRPSNTFIVRFSLEDGATGLAEGSEVRVGGRVSGRVSRVMFTATEDGTPTSVDVRIRLDASLSLREDAVAYLELPLLGSVSVMNFPSLGDPSRPALEDGAVIRGRLAAAKFLSSAGYGEEQAQQLRDILARMDQTSRKALDMVTRFDESIVPNMDEVVASAKGRSAAWFENVDAALANARGASDDAKAFMEGLRSLLEENREPIDATIAKANDIVNRVDSETVNLLNAHLQDGRDGVAEARKAVEQVRVLLGEETPEIRRSMANFRLASDQLKLTMMEVRRAPWRLLYRPDAKELQYELLYDSARAYATAVSDLRAATEALEAARASDGSRAATDGATIDELIDQVRRSLDAYRLTEERFLNLLLEQAR